MVVAATRSSSSLHSAPRDRSAPSLAGGARVGVCIVGAGLAGMVAAYLLARDRRSVMVIDEGPIGGLHAAFEAAHLASVVEKPYLELERLHGTGGARLAAQSHAAAIDAVEAIVRRERIACEFERLDGYFFPAGSRHAAEEELAAARRAGVEDVELLRAAPIDGVDWGACLRYPAQAQFHPLKFLAGLAIAIAREGGRIHCGVGVKAIVPGRPAAILTSAGHRIEADAVVTPNAPRADGGLAMPTPPAIAHVIGLRVARGSVPRGVYWEASDPARCVRLRSHGVGAGEVLLVGGEDPRGDDDHTAYRYRALEEWARRRFPRAGEVVQRFTGHAIATPDVFAMAPAGNNDSESLYVTTGTWGTAMTRGVIAGMLVKEFVEGAGTPWADLYVPAASYVRRCASTPA